MYYASVVDIVFLTCVSLLGIKSVRVLFSLETWHGTPLKKLAFDMDDITSASQNHKTLFYKHGREWNYLISANRFSTDVFERAFVYDRDKILEYGYPRNDILYADNKEEIAISEERTWYSGRKTSDFVCANLA